MHCSKELSCKHTTQEFIPMKPENWFSEIIIPQPIKMIPE